MESFIKLRTVKFKIMKNVVCAFLVILLGLQFAKGQKKEFSEQIKREISFGRTDGDNTLVLKNVFGSITVEGYDGNVIELNVDKTIKAKTSADLELGKQELSLKVVESEGKIFVHPDSPYIKIKDGHLNYSWCNDYEEPAYSHNMNFTIRIPWNIKLDVSTVNDGEILVKNTKGSFLKANNINGGIELRNITGQTEVHAINGEVLISYAANPKGPSTYYSLNGDINITYQKDLSAEIAFKSMNGELFTDFDIARQYAKTSKDESGTGKKGKFKYESKPVVQIGEGNLFHDFETLNGDVIIKKI